MMDYFRQAIGLAPARTQSTAAVPPVLQRKLAQNKQQTPEERLQLKIKTQQLQADQKREEISDLDAQCREAVAARDKHKAASLLTKKKQVEGELRRLEGMLNTNRAQIGIRAQAEDNLDQALLLQDAAPELKDLAEATEAINVDDAVDQIQDAAQMIEQQSERMSEPLLVGAADLESQVQDEVDAMIAQQDSEDVIRMGLDEKLPSVSKPQQQKLPQQQQPQRKIIIKK